MGGESVARLVSELKRKRKRKRDQKSGGGGGVGRAIGRLIFGSPSARQRLLVGTVALGGRGLGSGSASPWSPEATVQQAATLQIRALPLARDATIVRLGSWIFQASAANSRGYDSPVLVFGTRPCLEASAKFAVFFRLVASTGYIAHGQRVAPLLRDSINCCVERVMNGQLPAWFSGMFGATIKRAVALNIPRVDIVQLAQHFANLQQTSNSNRSARGLLLGILHCLC